MLPIRVILHPTDFSERSQHALHMASALARDYQARLVLLHVVVRPFLAHGEGIIPPDPTDLYAESQALLNQVTVPISGISVERRLEEGDPPDVILHVAKELPADLIVMGSHGRTGLSRVLMGSTAEQVLRRAPCPVLTVTQPFPPQSGA